MPHRSEQLQIRVTPGEKSALRRLARAAGLDLSTYVLDRALPTPDQRLADILDAVRQPAHRRFALAELHDLLASLASIEFGAAMARADLRAIAAADQNYIAAMVEHAASVKGVDRPQWTRDVPSIAEPTFAAPLPGLRAWQLRAAPVAFRRRNIFVDATIGTRV